MKHPGPETIAAIATPTGPGGVGVIRISGQRAARILAKLFHSTNGSKLQSHRMLHGWLIEPRSKDKVDKIMACLMRAPKSYTGEDVAELYCHGGMAVVQRALDLALVSGARLARKGEFTKRAFLNGKLDLTQAEAVLDLVQAQTAGGAGRAVRLLEGRLSKIVDQLRAELVQALAGLEALIDFPEDLPEIDRKAMTKRLKSLNKEIGKLLGSAASGRIFRQGLATVIIGKPNVGKSSLLNALLGEERAIVTRQPGTTRDTLVETINLQGLPLRIIDTAGIRHPRGRAEVLGVGRAVKELEAAELAIVVLDASRHLSRQDRQVMAKAGDKRCVVVLNKVDLGQKVKTRQIKSMIGNFPVFTTSALYGQGISALRRGIHAYVVKQFKVSGRDAISINARHAECLKKAQNALLMASETSLRGMSADFIAIDLKAAVIALGEVTGELVSEEVINAIFSQFCVGK